MTKYITTKGPSRCSKWHKNKDCPIIKASSREATQSELDYHDLEPCGNCVEGVELPTHHKQDWRYQELTE